MTMRGTARTVLAVADDQDRAQIYRRRHDVYATELAQHPENSAETLSDALDAVNVDLVARRGDPVVGFVAITPPNATGYSIDKYFPRPSLPLVFNDSLYELRLLTVVGEARGSNLASFLMYGAFRYCESRGGARSRRLGGSKCSASTGGRGCARTAFACSRAPSPTSSCQDRSRLSAVTLTGSPGC